MRLSRILFIASLIFLVFSSCSNLRQLTTYWESELKSDTVRPTGYDALTKVGWTSYNDSTHLFFAVDLLDPGVQMSVLRSGLTIYIDTTGKLKEDCSVTYPLISRSRSGGATGDSRSASSRNRNQGPENPVVTMLANAESIELMWKKGEKAYKINPAQAQSDFISLVSLDSLNYLSLLIGVPLNMIQSGGFEAVNELTIGFGVPMGGRSGGQAMVGGQGQQNAVSGGGGGGRGGGGGGRGGGGGGRGSGGQMGGGSPGGGMQSMGPVMEKFWYRTTIRRSGAK